MPDKHETSYNFTPTLISQYEEFCQRGEIERGDILTVSISLQANTYVYIGTEEMRIQSPYSEYSNTIEYSTTEDHSLAKPTNLTFSADATLAWDTVEDATYYNCEALWTKDGNRITEWDSSRSLWSDPHRTCLCSGS